MTTFYVPPDPYVEKEEFLRQISERVDVTPEEYENLIKGTVSDFSGFTIITNEDEE